MRTIAFLLLPVLISSPVLPQAKYEKETRVRKSSVPEVSRDIVDLFNFNEKVRWYKETGFYSNSFEAKTRYNGKNHSIEFSNDGTFEDIEIEIDVEEISKETHEKITNYLSGQHYKYILEKIQIQYSGNINLVSEYFLGKGRSTGIRINYELVISGRVDGTFKMLEYLFSEEGNFLQKAEIKLNRTDNIEY